MPLDLSEADRDDEGGQAKDVLLTQHVSNMKAADKRIL